MYNSYIIIPQYVSQSYMILVIILNKWMDVIIRDPLSNHYIRQEKYKNSFV